MYKVEKGVEIPEIATKRKGRQTKYPFSEMEVGDSFLITEPTDRRKVKSMCSQMNTKHKKAGEPNHFVSAETEQGLRVWRDK